MDVQTLISTLQSRTDVRILVLGDLILDRYTWGDAERVSPEAPVLVLRVDQREVRLGGAASVAALLRAWDVRVDLATVIGCDSTGLTARRLLAEVGIGERFVMTDEARPTTEKERFLGRADHRHPHQILRVDQEVRGPIAEQFARSLTEAIVRNLREYDAVLISDYAKGVCTPELLGGVIEAAKCCSIPVLIDPARLDCFERYRGANLLKPNRVEAARILGRRIDSVQDAKRAGRAIAEMYDISEVVVTLDGDGMVSIRGETSRHIASRPRAVYDITGAGDMALAMLGLATARGATDDERVVLANLAAGLEVERWGVQAVLLEDLIREIGASGPGHGGTDAKHVSLNQAASLAQAYRRHGKKIVFTNGCFDLLHVGHVSYLEEARRLGDVLFVAINSDHSVRRLKGPTRPMVNETHREQMLAALTCVDHVLVFDDSTPHRLLEAIRPNILVKGGTYTVDEVMGKEVVEAYGGRVAVTGQIDGVSTTQILRTVAEKSQ